MATSPSVQVSDSGIASHENLDFVTKRDFQLQVSNLQTVSQFQLNITTVLSAQSRHPGGLSSSNCVATSTGLDQFVHQPVERNKMCRNEVNKF